MAEDKNRLYFATKRDKMGALPSKKRPRQFFRGKMPTSHIPIVRRRKQPFSFAAPEAWNKKTLISHHKYEEKSHCRA